MTPMRRWLRRDCPLPRWLVLALIVLAAAAFVLPYAQTNALSNEARALRVELTKIRENYSCIYYLDPPFWGALASYPRVLAGLACTLLVLLGLAWGLRTGRSSSATRSPLPATQSPPPDTR